MTFPARFPGRCAACDERIREGDLIRMTDDGAVHGDCSTAEPERDPLALDHPACPVCWLTHPAQVSCDTW